MPTIRYGCALEQRNGADSNVDVLLVVGQFSALVVQKAQAHDLPLSPLTQRRWSIHMSTCNPATGRLLRDVLGR